MLGEWKDYYAFRVKEFIKENLLYICTLLFLVFLILSFGVYLNIESKKKIEVPVIKPYQSEEQKKEKAEGEIIADEDQIIESKKDIYKEIEELLYAGDYENLLKLIRDNLKNNPSDYKLKNYWENLNNELSVDFKFMYLPKRKKIYEANKMAGLYLTQKDPYYFKLFISKKCYLYLFQITSDNQFIPHFPSNKSSTKNPVPPGPFRIPDGLEWIYPDNNQGEEKIYLIATLWRNLAIEELMQKILAERDEEYKKEHIENLLRRIEIEREATEMLPGLVFGELKFENIAE